MTLAPTIDTSTYDTRAVLSWTAASNASEYRVSYQRDGQTSYTTAGTTSETGFETGDLTPNSAHEGGYTFKVEALDNSGSVLETDTVTGTLETATLKGPYTLVLRLNGQLGQYIHGEGDDEDSNTPARRVQATLRHTTQSQWEFKTGYNPTIEEWAFSEVFLYAQRQDGGFELVMRGRLDQIQSQDSRDTTTLRGRDVISKLTTGSTIETYSATPTHEAIRDYVDTHLPAWDWQVDQPSPKQIADDELVQDASTTSDWQSVTSLPDDKPVDVSNDRLELLQSAVVTEGVAFDTGQAFTQSDPAYSAGTAVAVESAPGSVTWDVSFDYDVPAEHVGIAMRYTALDDGNDVADVDILFNGEVVDRFPSSGVGFLSLDWQDMSDSGVIDPSYDGYTGTDLTAGNSYPLTINVDSTGDASSLHIDVIAVYDTRYQYFFDNDNGGDSGYLDGPQLYPDAVEVSLDTVDAVYNITSAAVTSTWRDNNVDNDQLIAASNTGGVSYDFSAANSTTLSGDFSTFGTLAKVKLTLSRYGTRTDATPQTGYKGQAVDSLELRLDGNDLSVLDDFEASGSDFDNLRQLHKRAGYLYNTSYHEQGLEAHSFARGSVLDDQDWAVIDTTRDLDTSSYYNKVTVRGKGWSVDSPSPEATFQDDDEVQAHPVGVVEARPVTDPDLTTEGDCKSRARELVAEGSSEDELTGTQRVYSKFAPPGYDDLVEEWNDQRVTREKVVFSESQGDATGTVYYQDDPSLVGPLEGVASGLDSVRDSL